MKNLFIRKVAYNHRFGVQDSLFKIIIQESNKCPAVIKRSLKSFKMVHLSVKFTESLTKEGSSLKDIAPKADPHNIPKFVWVI